MDPLCIAHNKKLQEQPMVEDKVTTSRLNTAIRC